MSVDMVPTMTNDRWPILLPRHRAARPINPFWEAHRLAATYSRIIRFGDSLPAGDARRPRLLEIGAEEGDFSCLYSMWGADVFLVEPNPEAWPWIKATFEANGVKPAGWFVGLLDSSSQEPDPDSGWLWTHSNPFRWPDPADTPDPTPEHGFHHLSEHREVDSVWSVDDMLTAAHWQPDFVTMDIEGGELHCLRGATRMLDEARPELFISIHPEFMSDLYGHEPADVHELMSDHGYRGQFLCVDHEHHYHFVPREKPWPWSDPH